MIIFTSYLKIIKAIRQVRPQSRIGSLAGRYDNPIPTGFLAPIDCLKIPAQSAGFLSSRPNWLPLPPHRQVSVAPPLVPGGGTHLLAGEGWGANTDEETDTLVF
jgi:hypothetical protein